MDLCVVDDGASAAAQARGTDRAAAGVPSHVPPVGSALVDWFDELAEFLRIPSMSADPAYRDDVLRAGEWVCARVREAGGECELIDWHGQPLAIGEVRASKD